MIKYKKSTRKKVSRKQGGKSFSCNTLASKTRRQLQNAAVIVGCSFLMSIIYIWGVSPFILRWKGVYSTPKYPDGYSIRGIDISHYQGKIDWQKVRRGKIGTDHVHFAFIKATEGKSLVDKYFKRNFHEAKEHGIIRGAYHFYTPSIPAEEQAEHFIRNVSLVPGDLPPVLDIETIGNLSPEELRSEVMKWIRIVEKEYRVPPIIYTYYKFKTKFLDTKEFDKYPYWIAHYYVDSLIYDGNWKFWQHTDNGEIKGISGKVDLNLFNGSMYNLLQLTIPNREATIEQE